MGLCTQDASHVGWPCAAHPLLRHHTLHAEEQSSPGKKPRRGRSGGQLPYPDPELYAHMGDDSGTAAASGFMGLPLGGMPAPSAGMAPPQVPPIMPLGLAVPPSQAAGRRAGADDSDGNRWNDASVVATGAADAAVAGAPLPFAQPPAAAQLRLGMGAPVPTRLAAVAAASGVAAALDVAQAEEHAGVGATAGAGSTPLATDSTRPGRTSAPLAPLSGGGSNARQDAGADIAGMGNFALLMEAVEAAQNAEGHGVAPPSNPAG